jgi:DNA (cytosine-5)-methyltransferase 1
MSSKARSQRPSFWRTSRAWPTRGRMKGSNYLRSNTGINRRTHSSYRPQFEVLSAADFGVPQLRRRFLLVAARDGTRFRFPLPTHRAGDGGLPLLGAEALPPHRTTWDALADIEPDPGEDLAVRGKWGDLLASIPEGHNYLWHTDRGGGKPLFGRRRYWSFLLKLAKSRPSWTIQAQPSFRQSALSTGRIGDSACASSAGFRRSLTTCSSSGTVESVHRQIGNGSLTPCGSPGARDPHAALGSRPPRSWPQAAAARSIARAAGRRLRPVPKRYWNLVGRHSRIRAPARDTRPAYATRRI